MNRINSADSRTDHTERRVTYRRKGLTQQIAELIIQKGELRADEQD